MAKYFHSTDCSHSPRNLKWPNNLTVLAVSEGSYCPATWDSLACWPQTKAGETAVISCPNYLNQFDSAGIYMHVNYIQTCSSRHLFFLDWVISETFSSIEKGIWRFFEFDTINWWSLMVNRYYFHTFIFEIQWI